MSIARGTHSFNDLFVSDTKKNTEARSEGSKDNNSYYIVKDEGKDLCFVEAKNEEVLGTPISATIKPTGTGDAYGNVTFSIRNYPYQDFTTNEAKKKLFKKSDCPSTVTTATTEEQIPSAIGGRKRKSKKSKTRRRKSKKSKTRRRKSKRSN